MRPMSYDGVSLNQSGGLQARVLYGREPARAARFDVINRPGRYPALGPVAYQTRQLPLDVYPDPASWGSHDAADVEAQVHALFAPEGGLRTLVVRRDVDDPTTELSAEAAPVSIQRADNLRWHVVLELPAPFVATTPTTDSPTTLAGTLPAYPVVTISTGAAITRYRVTISDRTGRGLAGEPLRIPLDLTASDTLVFQAGRSVPFRCAGGGLWVRVDVRPDVPTIIDVYTGAAINNSLTADRLLLGQLDPTTSTNQVWRFSGIAPVAQSAAIQGSGVWQPGITHARRSGVSYNFGLVGQSQTHLQFALSGGIPDRVFHPDATYEDPQTEELFFKEKTISRYNLYNDADSVILASGVEMLSVSGITTSRITQEFRLSDEVVKKPQGLSGTIDQATTDLRNPVQETSITVAYRERLPGTYEWRPASLGNLSGATEVAIGCEPGPSNYLGLLVNVNGAPTVTRDAARLPAIEVSEAIGALLVNGTLANQTNGTSITITDLVMDDTDLVIDTDRQTITANSGPWYCRGIALADAARWFVLEPGANTITNTLGATWTVYERWGI